jgi:hypothetical protein
MNGKVGIGTTAPAAKLHILAQAAGTAALQIQGQSGDTWFPYTDGKNYIRGTTILADVGGNVGIGTTTPQNKLDVNGTINATGDLRLGQYGVGISTISGSGYSGAIQIKTHLGLGGSANRYLRMGFADNTGFFLPMISINDNSSVGIGTTEPTAKLQIAGNGGTSVDIKVNGRLVTGDANNAGGIWVNENMNMFMGQSSSSSLGFYNNGAWRMTVEQNGNVGIGTTQPNSYKLAVAGTIGAWGEVRVFTTGQAFPDYVFDPSYKLPTLEETEKYVKENHHLPEVPTAADIAKDGMSLNEMNVILLKKVEELTLYMIEMKKENDARKSENDLMKKEIKELKENQKK